MTILALEFSSAQRSVALARDGQVLASAIETGDPRVTNAFGLIEKVLAGANVARESVEAIVVGLGPGSYTGIRAAIAVAQGWQLAREVKLLGISSVEAIAARAQAEKIFGRANIAVDAQRGEFYLAAWELSAEKREGVQPLQIVTSAEVNRRVQAGELCAGPAAAKLVYPDAATLTLLATGRRDFVPGERLEPIYLRETSFVKAPVSSTSL